MSENTQRRLERILAQLEPDDARFLADRLHPMRPQQEIEELNALLLEAQEIAGIGWWQYDVVANAVTWSESLYEICGVTHDEDPLGPSLLMELIHPDYRAVQERQMAQIDEIGHADFEYPIVRPDGEVRWIHAKGKTVRDDSGKPLRRLGVTVDITKQKQVQERFDDVQRYAGIGTFEWNIEAKTARRSKQLCELLGIDESYELTMEGFLKLVHEEDAHVISPESIRAALDEERTTMEYRIVRPRDGETRHVKAWFRVTKGRDAVPKLLTGAIQDITELKRAEEMLHKQQRLESLGLLAAGIAHDFNNLLGGVFGNIDLARENVDNRPYLLERLERAMTVLDLAKDLTSQLLVFSKGGTPRKQAIPVVPLIDECLALALSGSNIESTIEVGDDLWWLEADPYQLTQALNNILLNGRQAMPDGGRITIYAANQNITTREIPDLSPGRYVRIAVQDRGAGIAGEDLNKVFDPFFSTKDSGTGLGLSTCYSIAKKHKGTIRIDSEVGRGTTVSLYLPATNVAPTETKKRTVAKPKLKGRALVMDDEEALRDVISAYLTHLGFDVETAAKGEEAIRLFYDSREARCPFNLVLLDLTIAGGLGGEQTMAELRKIDPEVIGIVTSGYTESRLLTNPEEHGFAGKLDKPFNFQQLAGLLTQIFSKRHHPKTTKVE